MDVHQHDSGDARGGVAGVRSKAGAFDPPGERLADRAAIAAAHRHPSPSCSTLGVERAQTAGGRSTLSRFPWCPCSDTGSSSSAASASLANASSIHEDHTLAWVRAPGPPRFKPQGQAEKGAYRAASGAGSPRRQPRNPSSTRTPAYATPRAPVVAAKRRDAAARRYDRACGGIGGPRHGSPSANPPPTHGCGGDAVRFQVPRGAGTLVRIARGARPGVVRGDLHPSPRVSVHAQDNSPGSKPGELMGRTYPNAPTHPARVRGDAQRVDSPAGRRRAASSLDPHPRRVSTRAFDVVDSPLHAMCAICPSYDVLPWSVRSPFAAFSRRRVQTGRDAEPVKLAVPRAIGLYHPPHTLPIPSTVQPTRPHTRRRRGTRHSDARPASRDAIRRRATCVLRAVSTPTDGLRVVHGVRTCSHGRDTTACRVVQPISRIPQTSFLRPSVF